MLFDIYYLLNAISVTFRLPTDATDVARAGRAGRAGTRVGRLLKIVRMIRVFRVAKLYKETKKAMDEQRKVISKNTLGKRKSDAGSESLNQDDSGSDFSIRPPMKLSRATTFNFNDVKKTSLVRRRFGKDSSVLLMKNDKSFNETNNNDISNMTELGIITNKER